MIRLHLTYLYVMKAIPESSAGPQWGDRLFEDLAFIKKHQRYQLGKKTILPLLSLLVLLILGCRIIYTSLFLHKTDIPTVIWIVCGLLILSSCITVYNYYNLLRFKSIPTPFSADEGLKLVDEVATTECIPAPTGPGGITNCEPPTGQ